MPRANRRRRDPAPSDPAEGAGAQRVEEHHDGDWVVRRVTGAASTKRYRCPGCDHEISPATPHLVVWPLGDMDDRRHWHTPCWSARDRRKPGRRR
ncbi:MAG: hypothetical protein ACRDYU_03030 [Actinomycetes bacterium]